MDRLDLSEYLENIALERAKNHQVDLDRDIVPPSMTLSELILVSRGYGPGNFLEQRRFIAHFLDEFKIYESAERFIRGGLLEANQESVSEGGRTYTRYWLNPIIYLTWAKKMNFIPEKVKTKLAAFYKQYNLHPKKRGRQILYESQIDLLVELSNRDPHKGSTSASGMLKSQDAQGIVELICKGVNGDTRKLRLKRIERKLREHPKFGGRKNRGKE